jgi:hypothetical protein
VLWRAPNAPVFEPGKMFFLEHYGKVLERDLAQPKKAAQRGSVCSWMFCLACPPKPHPLTPSP